MSDRGLQYWSIKTAPGKNKLHKKQALSFFFAWFCLLYIPGMQRAVAAEQQSSVSEPAVISWIHKMQRLSWHEKLPAEFSIALSTTLKGICTLSMNAAGSGLTSSMLTLQPLAPSQRIEIFIQSLKQSQLHSNCLSSDCSLSHPPYHPCSSFPYLLHSSFPSTPALHLPNTTQNRTSFRVPPAPASAGKPFLFTEPSPWYHCSFQSLLLFKLWNQL